MSPSIDASAHGAGYDGVTSAGAGASGSGASGSGAGSSSTKSTVQRLASKPLKLAASSLRPLGLSRHASSASIANQSSSSALDQPSDPASAAGAAGAAGTKDLEGAPSRSSGRGISLGRRGLIRRKRANRPLRDNTSGLTPAQLAQMAGGLRKPLEGEEPAAWVRVRVVRANDLVAKDRNGTSDP